MHESMEGLVFNQNNYFKIESLLAYRIPERLSSILKQKFNLSRTIIMSNDVLFWKRDPQCFYASREKRMNNFKKKLLDEYLFYDFRNPESVRRCSTSLIGFSCELCFVKIFQLVSIFQSLSPFLVYYTSKCVKCSSPWETKQIIGKRI